MQWSAPKSQESFSSNNDGISHEVDFINDHSHESTSFAALCGSRVRRVTFPVPQRQYDLNVKLIELHVGARTIKNPAADFCVMFEFPVIGEDARLSAVGDFWCTEANLCVKESAKGEAEQFVLVPIVKVSQNGKHRRDGWIRSVVRLRSLDCCPNWLAERTDPSTAGILKVRSIVADGEGEAVFLGGRMWPRFMHGNCIDQVVQRRPQIVDAVRDYKRPSLERRLLPNLKNDTPAGRIRVSLSDESVWFSLYPWSKLRTIGCKVLFGSG